MNQTPDSDDANGWLIPPLLATQIEVSTDLLMDFGVILDTRPPLPPPSRRTRLRRKIEAIRLAVARRAYELISGYELDDDDY
jgi:hypothetical protein